jgi:hypothetical protein
MRVSRSFQDRRRRLGSAAAVALIMVAGGAAALATSSAPRSHADACEGAPTPPDANGLVLGTKANDVLIGTAGPDIVRWPRRS